MKEKTFLIFGICLFIIPGLIGMIMFSFGRLDFGQALKYASGSGVMCSLVYLVYFMLTHQEKINDMINKSLGSFLDELANVIAYILDKVSPNWREKV